MNSSMSVDRWKKLLVDYGYWHLRRFEARYTPRNNVIERVAFDLTNGDPTFQRLRDRIFRLPAVALLAMGITPNGISLLGVAFAFAAAFFAANPALFALFVIANLICDGLDGVAARYQKSESDFGSILDVSCDTISLVIVSIGLTLLGDLHVLLFVPYVAIILAYTYRSALKNKILDKVFLSIGSRIIAFGGLSLISLVFFLTEEQDGFGIFVNVLFGTILVMLSAAFFTDVALTKK